MTSTTAAEPSSTMKGFPNWFEMPHELMAKIFQRLHTVEILHSARKVCTTWQIIFKDPAMWKVIDMQKSFDAWHECYEFYDPEMLTKQAVDLSCGELTDITIKYFGTSYLIDHIVLLSSKLKRLCLIRCAGITGSKLSQAVKRVPQLEKPHLSYTPIEAEDIEVIGRNCPQLKSFKMNNVFTGVLRCNNHAFAIADNMPHLSNLELTDSKMTNDGLLAILNGCHHLQSLDVRMCDNLNLGGNLGKLCMERIKDFKHDSTEN